MDFEVQNALRDLDQRTPEFFRREIFAHGDPKVRNDAVSELKELDPERKSVRLLGEILKLYD